MVRASLASLAATLLAASAAAQTDLGQLVRPITSPVKNAGVYHAATGKLTRTASIAALGADVIYNNTCNANYFIDLNDFTVVDEGRIPSPAGPVGPNTQPGCATRYLIDGIEIGYCADQTDSGTFTLNFYEAYQGCTSALALTPTASFALTGLPGSSGGLMCWTITIDPASAPPAPAFHMIADAQVAMPPIGETFGWSLQSSLGATTTQIGPMMAGDYTLCSGFAGTVWDPNLVPGAEGTGMGTGDFFYLEGGQSQVPGCYFFGTPTIAIASFWLRLFATACPPSEPGAPFCFGDGSGTACPCGNESDVGDEVGCRNSSGDGGKLRASGGTPSFTNDTIVLHGSQMPNKPALYFQGSLQLGGGAGVLFGDGLRCVNGSVIQLKTTSNIAGASSFPAAGDPLLSVKGNITTPGTRLYQCWYRNPAPFCTTDGFNLTNGYQIAWGP